MTSFIPNQQAVAHYYNGKIYYGQQIYVGNFTPASSANMLYGQVIPLGYGIESSPFLDSAVNYVWAGAVGLIVCVGQGIFTSF